MKIPEIQSDLIRERALELRTNEETDLLIISFSWDKTNEGEYFWNDVIKGFTEEKLRVMYPTLDLWKTPTAKKYHDQEGINTNLIKENEELKKKLEEVEEYIDSEIYTLKDIKLSQYEKGMSNIVSYIKNTFFPSPWQEEISKDWTDDQRKEMLEYLKNEEK